MCSPPHKPAAGGRQHLHATLTPRGRGQLDETPSTHRDVPKARDFLVNVWLLLSLPSFTGCSLGLTLPKQEDSEMPLRAPPASPPCPPPAGCPEFSSNQCDLSSAVSPSGSPSGRREISQRRQLSLALGLPGTAEPQSWGWLLLVYFSSRGVKHSPNPSLPGSFPGHFCGLIAMDATEAA